METSTLAAQPAEMIVCRRLDGPPLRFKGRLLTHHVNPTEDLFVALWQRVSGGYVVCFSNWSRAEWRPDAVRVETLDDALCELEAVCEDMQHNVHIDMPATADMLENLRAIAHQAEAQSSFLTLSGHALSDWVDLIANNAS